MATLRDPNTGHVLLGSLHKAQDGFSLRQISPTFPLHVVYDNWLSDRLCDQHVVKQPSRKAKSAVPWLRIMDHVVHILGACSNHNYVVGSGTIMYEHPNFIVGIDAYIDT